MSKENEKRERTKESKEKESISLAHSARTREELQQIARSIPTVEQVISFAHTIIGFTDDDFIREWHRQMSMAFWCDEFGNPIRNWGWVFNKWRLNKKLFERLRDPERIPDARKEGAKRKAFRGPAPLDPKAAAFERQRSEAEERKRRAAELARALDAKGGAA